MPHFVYILRCADGSYYVGHTQHLAARERVHNAGRGAKYTAVRRPVQIVFSESATSKEDAVSREKQIKGWTRAKKAALIEENLPRLKSLSKRRS